MGVAIIDWERYRGMVKEFLGEGIEREWKGWEWGMGIPSSLSGSVCMYGNIILKD